MVVVVVMELGVAMVSVVCWWWCWEGWGCCAVVSGGGHVGGGGGTATLGEVWWVPPGVVVPIGAAIDREIRAERATTASLSSECIPCKVLTAVDSDGCGCMPRKHPK